MYVHIDLFRDDNVHGFISEKRVRSLQKHYARRASQGAREFGTINKKEKQKAEDQPRSKTMAARDINNRSKISTQAFLGADIPTALPSRQ
jgi:hypothetical protein